MMTYGEAAERANLVGDCLLLNGGQDMARRMYGDLVSPLSDTDVLVATCGNDTCIYVDHLTAIEANS